MKIPPQLFLPLAPVNEKDAGLLTLFMFLLLVAGCLRAWSERDRP